MRGRRAAMQDVEIVDVGAGASPADPAGDAPSGAAGPGDPGAGRARDDRLARRRAVVRRWWPVPAVVLAVLLGSQGVVDARERAVVAERQRVEGVLRTVRPSLDATWRLPQETVPVLFSGIRTGGLRIGPGATPWEGPRTLVALDGTGRTVWDVSLEPGGARDPGVPGLGSEYPVCLAAGEDPVQVVDCLVVDRGESGTVTTEDGVSVPEPPHAARLVSVDPAGGTVRGERSVPPLSSWGGDARLQVLGSMTGDVLTVTAWRPGDAQTGEPLWTTDLPLDADRDVGEHLAYPPGVAVVRGHVVVQGDLGSWALDARDGSVELAELAFLTVGRTGYLVPPRTPPELVDRAGRTHAVLPGTPVGLGVDDGSAPELELLATDDGRLAAFDVDAGTLRWRAEEPDWDGGTLVLLDGTLYGTVGDALWALDVATGAQRWRTPAHVLTDSGGVLTDGRHLLLAAATTDLLDDGIPVAAAAPGPTPAGADPADGAGGVPPGSRSLVAYTLARGELAWATRLPDGVQGVWGWQGDLLSYGDADVAVLN